MKCSELTKIIEKWAPLSLAESWDNPGLLIGEKDKELKTVLISLDITDEVIEEAIELKADIIITHHPLIFKGIKSITDADFKGRKILKLIQNNISHYAMHTNFDSATNGTNDIICNAMNLKNIQLLSEDQEIDGEKFSIGRIGEFESPKTLKEVGQLLKTVLELETIRVFGNIETPINKVGVCGGSAIEYWQSFKNAGADLYVTGDIRYHDSQKALDSNLCLIDATHYGSEKIIVPEIKKYLDNLNLNINIIESKINGETFKYV